MKSIIMEIPQSSEHDELILDLETVYLSMFRFQKQPRKLRRLEQHKDDERTPRQLKRLRLQLAAFAFAFAELVTKEAQLKDRQFEEYFSVPMANQDAHPDRDVLAARGTDEEVALLENYPELGDLPTETEIARIELDEEMRRMKAWVALQYRLKPRQVNRALRKSRATGWVVLTNAE